MIDFIVYIYLGFGIFAGFIAYLSEFKESNFFQRVAKFIIGIPVWTALWLPFLLILRKK